VSLERRGGATLHEREDVVRCCAFHRFAWT
jgi:hypothetical protein